MKEDETIILLSADMGYGLLDKIRDSYPDRFFNVGSSEQLMIGIATGFALEKKIPLCYSITSFLLYRPFEFIRNYMDNGKIPIKLVGGGRDQDYGYLGHTHHAADDIDILSQLQNIKTWKPENETTLPLIIPEILYNKQPCYINLRK